MLGRLIHIKVSRDFRIGFKISLFCGLSRSLCSPFCRDMSLMPNVAVEHFFNSIDPPRTFAPPSTDPKIRHLGRNVDAHQKAGAAAVVM